MTEHGDVERAAHDMAGRHYMNAIGLLADHEVREAVYEAGIAEGFRRMAIMAQYHADHDGWPGDTPAEPYLAFVEAITAANERAETDDAPIEGFQ